MSFTPSKTQMFWNEKMKVRTKGGYTVYARRVGSKLGHERRRGGGGKGGGGGERMEKKGGGIKKEKKRRKSGVAGKD